MKERKRHVGLVDLLTAGQLAARGPWLVTVGSSLVLLGSGLCLSWSPLAFGLHIAEAAAANALPSPCSSQALWPAAVYVLSVLAALPAGLLLDSRLGPRLPCLLGACLCFAACMGSTFALDRFWLLLLTLGVCNGCGSGLLLFSASTLPLRWRVARKPSHLIALARGTAFVCGFLLFVPLSLALLEQPLPPGGPVDHPCSLIHLSSSFTSSVDLISVCMTILFFSQLKSRPQMSFSTVAFALRVLASLAFGLQLVGCLFLENPPRSILQQQFESAAGEMHADSELSHPLLLAQAASAAAAAASLPQQQNSNLSSLYCMHMLAPFSLAPVAETAAKLQALYLSPSAHPSPWQPSACGISLRVRQAVRKPRAWLLLTLGCLDACICCLLLCLWRCSLSPSSSSPARHAELHAVLAGLFALLAPAFWGAFLSSSSGVAGVCLLQTVGALACACGALAASRGAPAFADVCVALSVSFFVGCCACLPRLVAIAFGPHRLGLLLVGFAAVSVSIGLSAAAALAAGAGSMQGGLQLLFAAGAVALAVSPLLLFFSRCCCGRKADDLDKPAEYHLIFEDAEGADAESEASSELTSSPQPEREASLSPSSYSSSSAAAGPLNLRKAVREYQQQQRRQREFSGPLMDAAGEKTETESILYLPMGPFLHAQEAEEEAEEREG
ncbi:hypothetical protein Efla_006772 [Eimeria flavescens]